MDAEELALSVRSRWLLRFLSTAATTLVLTSIAASWLSHYRGHDWMFGLAPKVDLDKEGNIPTYFASVLLLFCAILLAIIALNARNSARPFAKHWGFLAGLFAFLSVDEAAGFHELTIGPLRGALNLTGALHFAWVIPGGILVALLAAVYLPLVLSLPTGVRLRVVVAGCVFLSGCIGVEMVGAHHSFHYGEANFRYSMITSAEESLEFVGVIVFIGALLSVIECRVRAIRILVST